MTRHFKTGMVEQLYIESVTCDVCQTTYDDEMELQEMVFLDFITGYGSVFGDGTKIDIDICQHCLKRMIDENTTQKMPHQA